jgi:hypothetical protein
MGAPLIIDTETQHGIPYATAPEKGVLIRITDAINQSPILS